MTLAGCAAAAPGPVPSDAAGTLPEGLTVAVTQLRSDVAERQAQVQIRNGTDETLRIGAVRLDDPRFEGGATRVVDRTSTVAAGATVNVRVQLPDAACDADGAHSASNAPRSTVTVMVDYEIDGRAATGTATADEVFPFLDALHARDCAAARVAEIAAVGWGAFTPSAAGQPAELELTVVPQSGTGTLAITGIRETNLLSFVGVSGGVGMNTGVLPLGVEVAGADRPASTVALPLLPARCDPHAVQEDKRGTVFTLEVTVDGTPGQVALAAPPELRSRLLTWVTEWCGYG